LGLTETVKKSLKRGSKTEVELSLKTLSIIGVTLGTESESIFKEISPLLDVIVKDTEKDVDIRAAAEEALSSLYFIACTDDHAIMEHLSLLQTYFTMDLCHIALRCWGLLTTRVLKQYIHSTLLKQTINPFVSLLDSPEIEIRSAAGENIALLIETERDLCTEEAFDLNNLSTLVDVDDMLSKLSDLANDRNRYQAKKDIIKQRSSFKEIYKYINDDELDGIKLTFNKQPAVFDSWVKLKQLAFFRETIGEGLQTHFVENEFIQEVFSTFISAEEIKQKKSAVEKRLTYGTTDRIRTQNRSKNRQIRHDDISNGYDDD